MTSTANPPLEMVDDLDCSIVGPSTDDDGDAITYTYTWYDPNGVDVQVVPGTTLLSDTFPALLRQPVCGNVSLKHLTQQIHLLTARTSKWMLIGMVL